MLQLCQTISLYSASKCLVSVDGAWSKIFITSSQNSNFNAIPNEYSRSFSQSNVPGLSLSDFSFLLVFSFYPVRKIEENYKTIRVTNLNSTYETVRCVALHCLMISHTSSKCYKGVTIAGKCYQPRYVSFTQKHNSQLTWGSDTSK